jgi:hypothetical protein
MNKAKRRPRPACGTDLDKRAIRARVVESLRQARNHCGKLLAEVEDWGEFEGQVMAVKVTFQCPADVRG